MNRLDEEIRRLLNEAIESEDDLIVNHIYTLKEDFDVGRIDDMTEYYTGFAIRHNFIENNHFILPEGTKLKYLGIEGGTIFECKGDKIELGIYDDKGNFIADELLIDEGVSQESLTKVDFLDKMYADLLSFKNNLEGSRARYRDTKLTKEQLKRAKEKVAQIEKLILEIRDYVKLY